MVLFKCNRVICKVCNGFLKKQLTGRNKFQAKSVSVSKISINEGLWVRDLKVKDFFQEGRSYTVY